ncbi:flagellar protein FlgN [Candidatus Aerophobetes bacterium]|nr:flagellar protein FlgN [Candidatus Aerophobetes bacterium]
MEKELKNLINILEEELKLYQKLHHLCQKEEETVIKGNLKKLEEIIKNQESIFLQIKTWEEARRKIIEILRKSLSLPNKVTLSRLIKATKRPFSSQLRIFHKKITSLIKDIDKINKSNIFLIEYSIKLIDEYFHFLTGVKSSPVYVPNGKNKKKYQLRKLIDQKT